MTPIFHETSRARYTVRKYVGQLKTMHAVVVRECNPGPFCQLRDWVCLIPGLIPAGIESSQIMAGYSWLVIGKIATTRTTSPCTLSAGVQGSTWSCTAISDRLLSACVFRQWQKRTAIVHAGWPHRRFNINKLRATILCCVSSSSMEPIATRHQESAVAGIFQTQTQDSFV